MLSQRLANSSRCLTVLTQSVSIPLTRKALESSQNRAIASSSIYLTNYIQQANSKPCNQGYSLRQASLVDRSRSTPFLQQVRSYARITEVIVDESVATPFTEFKNLSEKRIKRLHKLGLENSFPIQSATYDHIREGKDMIARARTGTGKTLAFTLPIIEEIQENPSLRNNHGPGEPLALVLAPTRELACQVESELRKLAPEMSTAVIYGGTNVQKQCGEVTRKLDFLVATPGRLLDFLKREYVSVSKAHFLVLDEADYMLEMGFQDQMDQIMSYLPKQRQTLLFSATIPDWVLSTSTSQMQSPIFVNAVGSEKQTALKISHKAIYSASGASKELLLKMILEEEKNKKLIIFTNTKRICSALDSQLYHLERKPRILHSDIGQGQREKTIKQFKDGDFNVLIATDVAARGLDIPEVDTVIHYDIPQKLDSYIHRSGRCGRAGNEGESIVLMKSNDLRQLYKLEKGAGVKFSKENVNLADKQQQLMNLARKHLTKVNSTGALKSVAAQLYKEDGIETFAQCLATVLGLSSSVSLLDGREGYTTFALTGSSERARRLFRNAPSLLKNLAVSDVVGTFCASRDGSELYVDVAERKADYFLDSVKYAYSELMPLTAYKPSDDIDFIPYTPNKFGSGRGDNFDRNERGKDGWKGRGRQERGGGDRGRWNDRGGFNAQNRGRGGARMNQGDRRDRRGDNRKERRDGGRDNNKDRSRTSFEEHEFQP